MVVDISNKVIIITGGSRGIGKAVARKVAQERAKVVINYCNSDIEAKKVFGEISSYNNECMLIRADITKQSDVTNMYTKVIEKYGRVDVLINNAGIIDDEAAHIMSVVKWQKVIDVNLTGTFFCCQEFMKIMIKQNNGKIINIASLKGQEGAAQQVNYASSKAGVIALTKSLAQEVGKYNISVNAVCPGFIVTDLNKHDDNKRINAIKRSLLPIDKMMDDVVNFMVYMSSDYFNGISGRVFNLDSRY